jgi:hypothetical protein
VEVGSEARRLDRPEGGNLGPVDPRRAYATGAKLLLVRQLVGFGVVMVFLPFGYPAGNECIYLRTIA